MRVLCTSVHTVHSRIHVQALSCLCLDNRPKNVFTMMTSSNGNIFRFTHFVRGIHRSPVNFPHKGQWRGALMFSLICAWANGWVSNRNTGDLRRHCAHYDVTVMTLGYFRKFQVTDIARYSSNTFLGNPVISTAETYVMWWSGPFTIAQKTPGYRHFRKLSLNQQFPRTWIGRVPSRQAVFVLLTSVNSSPPPTHPTPTHPTPTPTPPSAAYMSVNPVSIGSDNGLSPIRHQAITWTNAELSLIGPWGTNFTEIRNKVQNFSLMKMN